MNILRKPYFLILFLFLFLLMSEASFSASSVVFNLSTPQIFTPQDEDIYVNLSSKGVRYVDIKIYKLKDPVKFIINSKSKRDLTAYKFSYKLSLKEKVLNNIYDILNDIQYSMRRGLRNVIPDDLREKIKDFLGIETFGDLKPPEPPLNIRVNKFLRDEEIVSFFREHIPRPKERDWWSYRRISLPIKEIGTYLVEASYGGKTAYTLLVITNMEMIVKFAPLTNKFLVFLQDATTSTPLSGATVYIVRKDKVLAKGRTDENGIYLLEHPQFSIKNLSVLATKGKNLTISNAPYFYFKTTNLNVYSYTDRPIYKPGHTVYYKTIIRLNNIYNYILPIIGEKVKVTLVDPDYNPIVEEEKTIDEFGSISGKFEISKDAPMGFYTIRIDYKGNKSYTYFQVEEYEKQDFEAKISPLKKIYKKGEEIEAEVSANYYFGEPLRDGKVRYTVYAYPLSYRGDDYFSSLSGEVLVKEGKGKLDKDGKYRIRITPQELSKLSNSVLYIGADVSDWKNKLLYTECRVNYIVTQFLLSINADEYVYSKNQKIKLTIKAADIEKNPISTPATLIVKWIHWKKDKRIESIERIEEVNIENGKLIYLFSPKHSGSYKVEIFAQDKNGETVKSSTYLWVSGSGVSYNFDQIKIITDKNKYKMGDTIHALILLPEKNITVLYTLEGADIYDYRVVNSKENTMSLDIPLDKSYIGSVKLRVSFFCDGIYYTQYNTLQVENSQHKLFIEILPDKEKYKPAEDGEILIKVKDSEGKGVRAQLSIGIVDESIYALTYDSDEDIFDYFYIYGVDYYANVATSISYYFSFYGRSFKEALIEANKKDRNPLADFKEEEFVPGGRGGEPTPPHVRKLFPDTMYFNPSVVTDENGIAHVKVKFPDSLTSFRITVKAITKDTRVGQAKKNVYVKKDIFSRMSTPPFAVEGDTTMVNSIVHNYTEKDRLFNIRIKLSPGISLEDNTDTKELLVSSKREALALFKVQFKESGEASIRVDVIEKNMIYDALLNKLDVYPYGYHVKTIKSGIVKENSKKISVELSPSIKKNTVKARLEVDTSIITTLIPSFRYLIGYPYGCTEQTMSKLLPDIAVENLLDMYNIKLPEFKDLEKMIKKGIQRLYKYQHQDDGGWGWWAFDESSIIQTAYVLFGLNLLRENDYLISPKSLKRGYRYLLDTLQKEDNKFNNLSDIEKSYVLYVLTLDKDILKTKKDLLQKLSIDLYGSFVEKKNTPSLALSYMVLAFTNLEEPEYLNQIIYELKGKAIDKDGYIYWKGYKKNYMYITDAEATAWAGLALLRALKADPEIDKIAKYLLENKGGNRWINTKSTAISLLFLAEYLQGKQDKPGEWKLNIYAHGNKIGEYKGEKGETIILNIPKDYLNDIVIEKQSNRLFYYRLYLDYWENESPVKSDINIKVKYYKLIPHIVEGKYLFTKEPIKDGNVHFNDVILTEVELESPYEYYNAILEVPRPAGFEYIKDDWNYKILGEKEEEDRYYYTYKEYRKDKVIFFPWYVSKGKTYYTYLSRARYEGIFNILPPHFSLMYNPFVEGFGEKGRIKIVK